MQSFRASKMLLYLPLFVFFLFLVLRFRKPETNKLPPSPSKLPIIGNLHQLHGSLHHALLSLARKHGPMMLLHLGGVPTLVVSSADVARDVMKTYDHVFSSRPDLEIAKRLFYGKDIAFAPYGEYWRQLRKICVLQLLSAKKVQSFRFVREEEVALMMENIKIYSSSTSPVNLSEMFFSLSSDIVSRVALGRKYSEGGDGKKFKDMVRDFSHLLGVSNLGDLIPSLRWVNHFNGLYAKVEKSFKELDSFSIEVIEEHLRSNRRSHGGDEAEKKEEDFVDVMLRIEKDATFDISFTRDHIKAIILDMFGAGSDTSSVVLEWAMTELIRHPQVMEEVQEEVRRIARGKLMLNEKDTEELFYLKAVIKETLRLHPPVPLLVPRESIESVQIQGYHIPARTTVMINAFAIGRDPVFWEEADEFLPKRFLNKGSASIDFKGKDMRFIPFGAGRRGCPGILFATSEIEQALANLLNRYDWALPNGMDGKELDMDEDCGITVHRKNDLLVIAKPHYNHDRIEWKN